MPNLRVIHVLPYSAQVTGGHSNAVLTILEAQRRSGLEVHALSPLADIPQDQRRSIQRFPVTEIDFAAPGFPETALERAQGSPERVFHFHGLTNRYEALARLLRKKAIPYVATSHGNLNFRSPVHAFKKLVYIQLVTPFFRGAAGLHFLTQRERVRSRYLLPFWSKPVLVQGNLVEVPAPESIVPAWRQELQIPEQAFVFVFLGRLEIRCKGLDLLLQAFARLPGEPYLVLIGPDWEGGRKQLELLATQLGCAGRVRFAGQQFGDRKWSLLKLGDAFAGPSRWESFGLAHVEAMGIGLPAIVSTAMNVADEMTQHGAALSCGLTPGSVAEAMKQLAGDKSLREKLSRAGREWVRNHCGVDQAGAKFKQFYSAAV